jgi:uncharacterized repeat protein (TIGR03803 family)
MPIQERRSEAMRGTINLAHRIPPVSFGTALGALIVLSLVAVAHTVRAQSPAAEKVVYNFRPATGYYPTGVINGTAGNLYVATMEGGSNQRCTGGCGNILKLSPPGKATELYAFTPGVANSAPDPVGLTRDTKGVLYGTTFQGGRFSRGSVFKLAPSGVQKTLHNFDPTAGDGYYPGSGVSIDSAGNLFGTTGFGGGTGCGGDGCGIVYKVTPPGSETILYSFTGSADGRVPSASPILDAAGNLYGIAGLGGDLTCPQANGEGCGTVWKLDTSGNFTVLYAFTGGTDGAFPEGGLVMDPSGNLYGDAGEGGNLACGAGFGCGVIFRIDSSHNFTVLYAFAGGSNDGQIPDATLLRDAAGNLYGTTQYGGDLSCSLGGGAGCGVVFKLAASGNETILHAFAGGTTDGEEPVPGAALITDGKGNLYGTTSYGGVANGGVIFAVRAQ